MNRTKSVSQFLSDRSVCAEVNRVDSGLLRYYPESPRTLFELSLDFKLHEKKSFFQATV